MVSTVQNQYCAESGGELLYRISDVQGQEEQHCTGAVIYRSSTVQLYRRITEHGQEEQYCKGSVPGGAALRPQPPRHLVQELLPVKLHMLLFAQVKRFSVSRMRDFLPSCWLLGGKQQIRQTKVICVVVCPSTPGDLARSLVLAIWQHLAP